MKKKKSPLLILSILGVITTLSFVAGNTLSTHHEKELSKITNQSILAPTVTPQKSTPSPKSDSSPSPKPSPTPIPSLMPTPVSTPQPTPVVLILPAMGSEIIGEYTGEVLVFHQTYGDYRAHVGLDFSGEKNTPVSAVADGIITKNYFDYEHGYTVEIEHDDKLVSIYRNLSSDKMAQVGQVVRQGDVIGAMGDSGISENHLPYHLHFELQQDGVSVNPRDYFETSMEYDIANSPKE